MDSVEMISIFFEIDKFEFVVQKEM